MRSDIEMLVDSLELCLPDNIANCDNLTSTQKEMLIDARRFVESYYKPENKKRRIMLDAFNSALKIIGEENYKELACWVREFVDNKVCSPCEIETDDEERDCENCKKIDWNLRDMRHYVEMD